MNYRQTSLSLLLVLALCLQSATAVAMVCAEQEGAGTVLEAVAGVDHEMTDCHEAQAETPVEVSSHSESDCCDTVCLCLATGCNTLAAATVLATTASLEGSGTLQHFTPASLQGIQQVRFRPPIIR